MEKQSFNVNTAQRAATALQITEPATVAGKFMRKLFQFLFYLHLILITVLAIFLTVRGVVLSGKHHFQPRKWYPPLLASTATAGIFSLVWQWITRNNASRAIRICFWLGPLTTCALGILLLLINSAAGLSLGAFAIISAVIQSLYACWVNPRFEYAVKILSVSTAFPPGGTARLVTVSIILSVVYSSFLVSAVGGATAIGTKLDVLFIAVILLSLAWSMQVIKNVLQVTISRVRSMHFAFGADMEIEIALRDTTKHLMGSVCVGSVCVPIFGVIQGSARTMSLMAGERDEFLFSCADCYSAVASTLAMHGNRWGFVHVGVYNKGFIQASFDTWEMFKSLGLETLINSDLTGAFCFISGVAGGALSGLVGGTWAFSVHKSYATEVSSYAFLIGYFIFRIAMAWPQACVSSYYVAYAENPQHPRFDSIIPARIQEIQRYQKEEISNPDPAQRWEEYQEPV